MKNDAHKVTCHLSNSSNSPLKFNYRLSHGSVAENRPIWKLLQSPGRRRRPSNITERKSRDNNNELKIEETFYLINVIKVSSN
jgi:hypothetical protein